MSKDVTKLGVSNREDLIKKITKKIPLKMIQDFIKSFRSRVHVVKMNQGGFILNKLS